METVNSKSQGSNWNWGQTLRPNWNPLDCNQVGMVGTKLEIFMLNSLENVIRKIWGTKM